MEEVIKVALYVRPEPFSMDPDYARCFEPDPREEAKKEEEYRDTALERFREQHVKGPKAAGIWDNKSREEKIEYMLYGRYKNPL